MNCVFANLLIDHGSSYFAGNAELMQKVSQRGSSTAAKGRRPSSTAECSVRSWLGNTRPSPIRPLVGPVGCRTGSARHRAIPTMQRACLYRAARQTPGLRQQPQEMRSPLPTGGCLIRCAEHLTTQKGTSSRKTRGTSGTPFNLWPFASCEVLACMFSNSFARCLLACWRDMGIVRVALPLKNG